MARTDAIFVMPDLKGQGGNAYFLLGDAKRSLKEAGVPLEERERFYKQATSGDYENLLETIMEWFTVVVPKTQYVPINLITDL